MLKKLSFTLELITCDLKINHMFDVRRNVSKQKDYASNLYHVLKRYWNSLGIHEKKKFLSLYVYKI